jgi:hypothetical protein
MAIALPLASTGSGFPTIQAAGDHEWGPNSDVLNFTPETFVIPADANARFRRLVSTYRLQAVDRTKGSGLAPNDPRLPLDEPTPPATNTKGNKAEDKSATTKKKAEVKKKAPKLFAKAEPRWMLWSVCEPWM